MPERDYTIPEKTDEPDGDTLDSEKRDDDQDNARIESSQATYRGQIQEEDTQTTEDDYIDQLEQERASDEVSQEAENIVNEGRSFGKPSLIKYGFLGALAGIKDIIDLLGITGLGLIVTYPISIACTLISLVTLWLTDTKLKNAQDFQKNLDSRVSAIRARAKRGVKVAKLVFGSKKVDAAIAKGAAKGLAKLEKFATRSPGAKILIGGAIDLIPFLSVINLSIFWVWYSYHDEKKTYLEAKRAAEDAARQLSEELT